jgi:uncharacterized protein Yka (UPF0111/DUF47 family)
LPEGRSGIAWSARLTTNPCALAGSILMSRSGSVPVSVEARETVLAIHRTFVTPFDRSQILDLITALDDTIDLMKDTGRRMLRYGVGFTSEMQGMADCIVRATRELRDGMPLLGSIDRSVERLSAMSVAVRQIEGEADELLDRGLRILFASDKSAGYKLTVEKVYDLVEAVVDRCEDVVDVIDGIVVEQV